MGSTVPLEPLSRGREKILRLAVSVASECFSQLKNVPASQVPILLCLAEGDRPGRFEGLDDSLLADLSKQLKIPQHVESAVISNGRIGGVEAVLRASKLIEGGNARCLIVGADSFLVGATLASFEERNRLLTSTNSDGFIPGEAGAAVLLGPADDRLPQIHCIGIGFGREKATVESDEPLRADGLAEAIRAAMDDVGCTYEDVDYRVTDVNGEQYGFREAELAMSRTMRVRKSEFDIWHPADCIGEIGAAILPCVVGVVRAAALKGYAPGKGALCHFSNDDGARAALIVRTSDNEGA